MNANSRTTAEHQNSQTAKQGEKGARDLSVLAQCLPSLPRVGAEGMSLISLLHIKLQGVSSVLASAPVHWHLSCICLVTVSFIALLCVN